MSVARSFMSVLGSVMYRIPAPQNDEEKEHNRIVRKSESPIEGMMMFGLLGQPMIKFLEDDSIYLEEITIAAAKEPEFIFCAQQVLVPGYRLDFVLAQKDLALNVECDGKDFHHSSMDQIHHDYKRMIWMAKQRVYTMRFTGSQIFTALDECVADIMGFFR